MRNQETTSGNHKHGNFQPGYTAQKR